MASCKRVTEPLFTVSLISAVPVVLPYECDGEPRSTWRRVRNVLMKVLWKHWNLKLGGPAKLTTLSSRIAQNAALTSHRPLRAEQGLDRVR